MIPASSVSHSQTDRKLWPSARAALISGQSAQIWPDLVSGFFARRCARRFRVSVLEFVGVKPPSGYQGNGKEVSGRGTGRKFSLRRRLAADRNRAQRSATVSGGGNNPQQFETYRNRRQQQGESQAAKNLVVEHKQASNRALDILSFALFGSTDSGVGQRVVSRLTVVRRPQSCKI